LSQSAPAGDHERTVFIGAGLSDEDVIAYMSGVAAGAPEAIALIDCAELRSEVIRFLDAYRPTRIIRVGRTSAAVEGLKRLGRPGHAVEYLQWTNPFPEHFWKTTGLSHKKIVVCRARPRSLLLHAACLAGVLRAPLCILHGQHDEAKAL